VGLYRDELPALLSENFALDMDRQAICGHSMGGHGAADAGDELAGRFTSVSAFARDRPPHQQAIGVANSWPHTLAMTKPHGPNMTPTLFDGRTRF